MDADEVTIDTLAKLGTRKQPSVDTMDAIKKIMCRLFAPKTAIMTVKELRWSLFRKKQAQSEKLRQTQAALRQAIMRANYQTLLVWNLDTIPFQTFRHRKSMAGS